MNKSMPDATEIGYSRSRMLRLIGIGAFMTLLSASIAFNWLPYGDLGANHLAVAYAGAVFFGLGTLKFVWTWFTAKGPVVFISRYGIRDIRVANQLIPWGSVESVSASEYHRQKFIVLKVPPPLERLLFASKAKQALLLASKAMGADGVTITASGLTVDFDALFDTCMAYYSAARPVDTAGLPARKMAPAL
jgi:hypothetical protein